MSTCASGCKTRDHSSYAECLRSSMPSVRVTQTSGEYKHRKKWDTEIREYRAARSQGIQPRSTQLKDIRSAVNRSRAVDKPVRDT